MRMERMGWYLATMLLFLGTAYTLESHAEGIKIGYIRGISATCDKFIDSVRKEMVTAYAETNSPGGVLGGPIEVVWHESWTRPNRGADQAGELTVSDNDGTYPNDCGLLGYNVMYIIARAIENAGSTDPEMIPKTFGTMTFNSNQGEIQTRTCANAFDESTFVGQSETPNMHSFPVLKHIPSFTNDQNTYAMHQDQNTAVDPPCAPYCHCRPPICSTCQGICATCPSCKHQTQ